MKTLVLLAIVVLAAKKAADFMLAFLCVVLFGYGSYVLIRDISKPGFLRSDAPRLTA